ncbi:MAG TPA: TIGR02444 family protein [Afipia sp.]
MAQRVDLNEFHAGIPEAAMDEEFPINGPLWQFALAFYGREGVPNACLKLQALVGVDVNILIFFIYAAIHRHYLLAPVQLAQADAAIQSWRSDVVVALRRIRIRLRTGPLPAPNFDTEVLRSQIKAAELFAERIELAILSKWLDAELRSTTSPIDLAHGLRTAVDFFISRGATDMSMHDAEIDSAIKALALAADLK